MKKLLTPLLLCGMASGLLAGGSSGGPWANGAYYAGYLNGKYMGVVTGNNIAGVLGFGIADGAPPFRTRTDAGSASATSVKVEEYSTPDYDITQNYFAIFVEGRVYTGITAAGIDIDSNTVAGALQGTDPIAVQPAVRGAPGPGDFADGETAISIVSTSPLVIVETVRQPFNNALSILNRGLSGGFTAKIKSKGAVFTFKGSGQLSTPANRQSYTASGYVQRKLPGDPPPGVGTNISTNLYATGIYETESTAFNIRGIRTSFNAFNLQATQDQNSVNTTGASAGGGQ